MLASPWKEHQAIVARELNPERKAFYQLAWHFGASQSDLCMSGSGERVDWENHIISCARKKTGTVAIMRFDDGGGGNPAGFAGPLARCSLICGVLSGAGDRATGKFKQRCNGSGHQGRYVAQLPLCVGGTGQDCRLSRTVCCMENLGQNSKAVHRAYSRKAKSGTTKSLG